MKFACALLAILMTAQVHANPADEKLDPAEVDYYNSLYAKCGDNLLCYFSKEEIQEALGTSPAEALAKGLLSADASDRFASEDFATVEENSLFASADPDLLGSNAGKTRTKSRGSRKAGGSCSRGTRHALEGYHQSGGPIWGAFIAAMKSCKPGCVPKDYNCYRPESSGFSCHNSSRAVDVGAIVCKGRSFFAIDRGPFADLVSCARRKGLKVLYMQKGCDNTVSHHNHGHFSVGCPRPNGGRYW
jgi:hypothetical protein